MAATTNSAQSVQCPRCFAVIESAVLVCPLCNAFIHAAQLNELTAGAREAEARKDWSEALRLWREALSLLPRNTQQYVFTEEKVKKLSAKVDEGQPRAKAERPAWMRKLGPLAGVFIVLWKFKAVVFAVLAKWKLLLFGLTKLGTISSMALSFAAYAAGFGWKYALGFVLSIYIHEMGHVYAAKRFGLKVSAPLFIPFIGAFILLKQHPVTRQEDARISLAGPMWGIWGAIGTYILFFVTQNPLLGAIGHTAAFMNLFNLTPIRPLDGSGAFRSLTRPFRIAATVSIGMMWVFTHHGLLLLVLGASIWQCFRKDASDESDRKALVQYVFIALVLSLLAAFPVGNQIRR